MAMPTTAASGHDTATVGPGTVSAGAPAAIARDVVWGRTGAADVAADLGEDDAGDDIGMVAKTSGSGPGRTPGWVGLVVVAGASESSVNVSSTFVPTAAGTDGAV
jgi:hypothetical protein